MLLEELIYEALALGSPNTDAGARVYPSIAAQGAALPYIVYTRVSTTPINALDGHSGLDSVRIQIDCYASTKPRAAALARQVRTLMGGASFKALPQNEFDDYEADTEKFRHSVDFTCWDKSF